MKFLIFFLLVSPVGAEVLIVRSTGNKFESAPEYKAMLNVLKSYGGFAGKTKSSGASAVEEAKARNRAIIASQSSGLPDMEELKRETRRTLQGWKKEVHDQRLLWKKEQAEFLQGLKGYQNNTFEIPAPKEEIKERVLEDIGESHIVNAAMFVPVRDQKARATCSAFAGVRALEILLLQNNETRDLSEQYFYWASKPKCQTSPCQEKGSWITTGLDYSKKQTRPDIPLESNCGYQAVSAASNETHVPLEASCQSGVARVDGFEEVRSIAEVVEMVKRDIPVVMAAKLTQNFYINSGLVTLEGHSKGKMDGHSMGHAFLAIGVMELPVKLHPTEGHYCVVVSNSWGKGWGAGGYSCLTEKWLFTYRTQSPFLAITSVSR
jgi:hypothetical protein